MKKIILLLFTTVALSNVFNPLIAANVAPSIVIPTDSSNTNPKLSISELVKEFRSLSRKERKARIKEVKKQIREYRKAKRQGRDGSTDTLLLVILAILLPPLAVYLHQGEINTKFWISLLLTLLFWLPGVIYALIVIFGAD